MITEEMILLHNVVTEGHKLGFDDEGNAWEEIIGEGTCALCGEETSRGWLCLSGGMEVCDKHILEECDVQSPC